MLKTSSERVLRSVINEAGRQASYYRRQQLTDLEEFWTKLERHAFSAKQGGTSLIIVQGKETLPPNPIMPCEQDQQLPKPNVIKAFQ